MRIELHCRAWGPMEEGRNSQQSQEENLVHQSGDDMMRVSRCIIVPRLANGMHVCTQSPVGENKCHGNVRCWVVVSPRGTKSPCMPRLDAVEAPAKEAAPPRSVGATALELLNFMSDRCRCYALCLQGSPVCRYCILSTLVYHCVLRMSRPRPLRPGGASCPDGSAARRH